jgi:hypothetical protein
MMCCYRIKANERIDEEKRGRSKGWSVREPKSELEYEERVSRVCGTTFKRMVSESGLQYTDDSIAMKLTALYIPNDPLMFHDQSFYTTKFTDQILDNGNSTFHIIHLVRRHNSMTS